MASRAGIILAHHQVRPDAVRQAIDRMTPAGPARWIYLGRDSRGARRWDAALSGAATRAGIGADLQAVAHDLRVPFLDWIADLGREHDSLTWWSSRLAERNTYIESLFHDICYLDIFLKYAQADDACLVVVVESRALLETLALRPEVAGRATVLGRRPALINWLAWASWMVVVWGHEVVQALMSLGAARISRIGRPTAQQETGAPRVLMHACLDETYFDRPGGGGDRYFDGLPEALRARGCDVVIMPWLMNIRRSRLEAFRWFRRYPDWYLIPEDYYRLTDYAWAAWVVIRQTALGGVARSFRGRDVTRLVTAAARRGAADRGIARFVRYARLFDRLGRARYRMDIFLDKFENMLTEKPQVWALRRHFPRVRTVGFQHYVALYPLQLHMFTTKAEAEIAPHPDVIVCNSPFSADQLRGAGFKEDALRVGPSLRYPHMNAVDSTTAVEPGMVLVVMPLEPLFAAELFDTLCRAFPTDEGIRFHLKAHPMVSETLWRESTGGPLPSHMVRVAGVMGDWLPQAACAITGGSTAALEAALAGVPVIVVGRETDFDFNPLAWFEEFDPPVQSADALRAAVLACVDPASPARAKVRTWAAQHRPACVSPMTDQTVEAFITPPTGWGTA